MTRSQPSVPPNLHVATLALLAAGSLAAAGCAERGERLDLPTVAQVDSVYDQATNDPDSISISGNVVELRYRQPTEQITRGGSLWARVGPYIYLFTPATRSLFEGFADVGGVRVITIAPDGTEIARAMLPREQMTDLRWRRSLNLLGHALQEGTQRPTRLEDLIEWGERHTEHRYEEAYR